MKVIQPGERRKFLLFWFQFSFLFMVFFCWPFFFRGLPISKSLVMPDWSKTHRGFAHLRLRFASVLSLLKLLSRRFCSSYSFRSFCYQHDDHTRLTRNQSFICSFELSVVNVSVAENHFKMLRFNRQTKDVGDSWTLVLFAYSVQEPLFSSSELCISADGCRWTAVKFADCPVIIDFVVNLLMLRDNMTREGKRLLLRLNSADKKSTAQTYVNIGRCLRTDQSVPCVASRAYCQLSSRTFCFVLSHPMAHYKRENTKRPEPDGPRQVASPFCANLLLLLFSLYFNKQTPKRMKQLCQFSN